MFNLESVSSLLIPKWAEYFLQPPLSAQIIFTVILLVTFILIATRRLHGTVAALGGAVVTLIFGVYFSKVYYWVPYFTFYVSGGLASRELLFSASDVYKEFIDWSTLLIIISIVVITTVASRSGLFEYIILRVVKFSGGDMRKLFLSIWFLAFLLTMLLSGDPTAIMIIPLILLICKVLDLNPAPYLFGTVFVINVAAASTLVASFINILVSGHYNSDPSRWLSYPTFMALGLPVSLLCMGIVILFIFRRYGEAFSVPQEKVEYWELRTELLSLDAKVLIENPKMFRKLSALLTVAVTGFIVAGLLHVPFYVVSLLFAFAFILVSGVDPVKTFREVDWSLVFFFIGVFIIVGGVHSTKILEGLGSNLGSLTTGNVLGTITLVTLFCGLLSGVMDNISVTTALLYVTPSLSASALINQNLIIWSLIFGSNMGNNLTPIGSLPNLLALTSLEKENIKVTWFDFMKLGAPIVIMCLFAAILSLILIGHLLGWGVDITSLFSYLYSQ
ncbi:MAG: SLC13 family permease [Candidatus Jordarchaeaceae archaeon]